MANLFTAIEQVAANYLDSERLKAGKIHFHGKDPLRRVQSPPDAARDDGRRRKPSFPAYRTEFHETPDELCERDELAHLVTESVAELPEPLREVLALRHDGNLNFEEMSRLLGTPASTLKSRFATALSRLRIRLHERGYSAEETLP